MTATILLHAVKYETSGLFLKAAQVVLSITILQGVCAFSRANEPTFTVDIREDVVGKELKAFYLQTGTLITYDPWLTERGRAIHGTYTAEGAVVAILDGTDLICQYVHEGRPIVVIKSPDHQSHPQCFDPQRHPPSEEQGPTPLSQSKMPEVTVLAPAPPPLGSHIQDSPQIGSAPIAWDKGQIRRSGAHNLPDLLERITLTFTGGPNQRTHFGQAETRTNSGLGTAGNLRGLGARATLALLNGRRIAPSGSAASFVDLLNIPLSTIESVDILLDGASHLRIGCVWGRHQYPYER